MGPPPTDGSSCHPGAKRHQRNLHSKLTSYHPPPLPKREEHDGIQADCALTYTGNNLYLPTPLCQYLPRGHILAITEPNAPTGLTSLLTLTSSARPENAQHQAMRIQFLLSMGQDHFVKRGTGQATGPEGPRPRVHPRAARLDKGLREVNGILTGRGYPGCLLMGTWPNYIDRIEQ